MNELLEERLMANFVWPTRVSERREFKVIGGDCSKEEVK